MIDKEVLTGASIFISGSAIFALPVHFYPFFTQNPLTCSIPLH